MSLLIVGLLLFLGVHSVRIVADDWRARTIVRLGEGPWKGIYALLSLTGLLLIVLGYAAARSAPIVLWTPPAWAGHAAALLVLAAFVLLAAAYVPGNVIQARLGHPMLAGTKVWAFAHLLANHTLADLLLFGSFLAWAVLAFAASRRRDRAAGLVRAPGRLGATVLALLLGVLGWAVFAFWAHGQLFGVRPFG